MIRLALLGGALAVTGSLAATAPLASAAPCGTVGGPAADAAHTVEGVVGTTPAGPAVGPVIHDAEPLLCSLP